MFDIKKKILELDGKQARNTSELTHEQILKIILENERLTKKLKEVEKELEFYIKEHEEQRRLSNER